MVNIYRNKNAFDLSSIIIDNESFFKNNISAKKLGKQSLDLMKQIDGAVLLDAGLGTIRTPYGITSIRSLSTGCKTVLNYLFILTHKKEYACVKAIDATECGWNAIEELFKIAESRESKIGIIIEHNNGLFNCSEREYCIDDNEYTTSIFDF